MAPKVWTFFYGSFINLDVLKQVDLVPEQCEVAKLSGFDICIRPLANLMRSKQYSVYGIVATATHEELSRLYEYAEDKLGGKYLPEPVLVETIEGQWRTALCYIVPFLASKPAANDYIDRIVIPAKQLGFPSWYIERLNSFRASTPGREIQCCVAVDASIDKVWEAWTTKEGIQSFFAPDCNIEMKVEGLYEILFDPSAKQGERGSENMRILAIQPEKMLSFTWNAPPHLSTIRDQRTHVTVRLKEITAQKTKVILSHDGWGEGEDWNQAHEYFSRAWGKIVLPRLQYRFCKSPIDWSSPPNIDKT